MDLSYLGQDNLARGLRNNNPGNIKINPANDWQGKVPLDQNTDGTFEQFYFFAYGVRAMIRLIRDSYMLQQGRNTIEKIILQYAPASENDPDAYTNFVSTATGYAPDQPLQADKETLQKLIPAMAWMETGVFNAISPAVFEKAWELST